jgi:Protein of unknown function (DUF2845)
MRRLYVFGTFLAASLAASLAQADAMRCGNRLVSFGDTQSVVLDICGEPVEVQRRTIVRRPSYDLHGRIVYFGDGYVEIPVEVWIYNFGPYKLMRSVKFIDGRVDDIETLGYGYHPKQPAETR